jgi:hypothetical protein
MRKKQQKLSRLVDGEGFSFEGEFPVIDRAVMGEKVFVLYDYMAFGKEGPARNLFCYTKSGDCLWRAADLGGSSNDAYVGILGVDPLWVSNFNGCNCRIDENTGIVLKTKFTK